MIDYALVYDALIATIFGVGALLLTADAKKRLIGAAVFMWVCVVMLIQHKLIPLVSLVGVTGDSLAAFDHVLLAFVYLGFASFISSKCKQHDIGYLMLAYSSLHIYSLSAIFFPLTYIKDSVYIAVALTFDALILASMFTNGNHIYIGFSRLTDIVRQSLRKHQEA